MVTAYPDGNLSNADFHILDSSNFAKSIGKNNKSNTKVGRNNFNEPHLYAFNEVQKHTLLTDLSIDGNETLLKGSVVSSHFVFFDPANDRRQEGWVTFDADIIGLITTTSLLDASDAELGAPGVTYKTHDLRGLENHTNDTATVDANDPRKIWVDWRASDPGDYMRVITQAPSTVPVPAALPLMLFGLGGLGWAGRRKASRKA